MALNRLCSSGLQAIVTTARQIMLGDCDYGIGGGVEVMSSGMYGSPAMRSGARMGECLPQSFRAHPREWLSPYPYP